MANTIFLVCLPLLSLFVCCAVSQPEYDYFMGNVTIVHSENAYCDPANYLTRDYSQAIQYLQGFVPTYHIQGDKDTEGYIGYTSSQSSIFVSFRGTSNAQNWLIDLDIAQSDYPLCDGCKVHAGFYKAEQSVISDIIYQVQQLKSKYTSYAVVVTGHSLGGALATLTALDLQNAGISNIRLFNYGSPRIGDEAFASYASNFLSDKNRVTHHKDIVPHVPLGRYTHISGEWFEENDSISVVPCEGFEDPNCSDQYTSYSVDDHLYYMGVVLGGDGELITND
jgi:predicted lipase